MKTLSALSRDLGLSPEMYKEAAGIYKEISTNLQSDLSGYKPDIFPQGSFRIGTAIRPLKAEDGYDLDFACLMHPTGENLTPVKLKELVGTSLKKHHAGKLREKNRCWRVMYDRFHVDVLPALPDANASGYYEKVIDPRFKAGPILIPEKGLATFRSSNPKGYALWFEEQASRQPTNKFAIDVRSVEKLPQYREPGVLQGVVQIMKRHRDYMFADDKDNKPISIIITTLAASIYGGEDNILNALINITAKMPDRIASDVILNPVNLRQCSHEICVASWEEV